MIYIGIVTFNSLPDLPQCLQSLIGQLDSQSQITVFDNNSQDGVADWIAQHHPGINLVCSEDNIGFARGHNYIVQTLRLQSDDFYMPLNPDVLLQDHYIRNLAACLSLNSAGWGTGKLLRLDENGSTTSQIYSMGHAIQRNGYAYNIGYGMEDETFTSNSREIFGAPGAAPLIAAKLIADLGALYDDEMFMYYEDVDLDWQAQHRGWRCWYAADAVAFHRGSRASDSLRIQALGNRYLSVIKNACWLDMWTVNLPLIVLHCFVRLLITPREGFWLGRYLLRRIPEFYGKRSQCNCKRMANWFRWSKQQPSHEPTTIIERLRSFVIMKQAYD